MAERGLIYGRASRDPKHRGTSVNDQIRECQAWADANGIIVLPEHVVRDDNRSASAGAKREREGFETILEAIRRGDIDVLIVWETSRAARDMTVFIELRTACAEAGVSFVAKGRRFDFTQAGGAFYATMEAVVAEHDASGIRDRNVRTVRRNAEAKRPHGRLPYGYRRVYDPTTGSLIDQTPFVLADGTGAPVRNASGELVPVLPDAGKPTVLSPEAQVIADAARDILAGRSLRQITRGLNERAVPSPRKPNRKTLETNAEGVVTRWTPESLRQRLMNPTIAGRRVYQGKDIGQATWAPIIDHGIWLKLHATLSDPSRTTIAVPRGPEPRHLLSGIARCGECRARLKARTNLSRMPRAYCCLHEGCRRVTVTAPKVDELVEAVLHGLCGSPGFRDDLAAAYREQSERADTGTDVSTRIATLEAERDELEQLRSQGTMTMRVYAVEDKRIEDEIERLREQQVAPVTSAALRRILNASTFAAGWDAADLYDRREIVRILISVTVDRATSRGRIFDYSRVIIEPSDFLLESWGRLTEVDLVELGIPEDEDPDLEDPGFAEDFVPPEPQTVGEWAERALERFPRPGPEVARRLANLLPPDSAAG